MRTLLYVLYRLAWYGAWIVVILAGGLIVLEETNLLARSVQRAAHLALGPIAEGIQLGSVRLRWFEPGLVLTDVTVHAPGEQEGSRGERLVHVDRLHVTLRVDRPKQPLGHVQVDGAQVCLSEGLWSGLNRLGALLKDREPVDLRDAPHILVRDLDVSLELPNRDRVDIGNVNLLASPEVDLGFALSGELRPSLSGAVVGEQPIRVEGLLKETALVMSAASGGLSLQTAGLRIPPSLGSMPVAAFEGRLDLRASTLIEFEEELNVEGSVRARVFDARLLPRPGQPWIEDLEIDLATAFVPRVGAHFWGRESWDSVARVRAHWNDTPLEAWGQLGRSAPEGTWARCFARAPRLPLRTDTLDALGVMHLAQSTWDALDPVGVADAAAELILHRDVDAAGRVRFPRQLAAHARLTGDAGITYFGFKNPAEGPGGEPWGVPMPCSGIRGHVLFVSDPALNPAERLVLADLTGEHAAGSGSAWGSMRGFDAKGEFDLEFEAPIDSIGEEVRSVLRQSRMTREVPDHYDPIGGRGSTRWRFRQAADTGHGLSAWGRIWVEDTQARWHGLPVPVRGTSGIVELLWSKHPTRVRGSTRKLRPIGVRWDVSNRDTAVGGVTASVRGFYRQESLPPEIDASEIPALDGSDPMGLEVVVDEVLLRGQDWNILTERIPELARERDRLQALGSVGVAFRGGRTRHSAPWVAHVEAMPLEVEVTPSFFSRRTQELRGRVLVRSEIEGEASRTKARVLLAGDWPQGTELAAQVEIPEQGDAHVRVLGAGVAPGNRAFKGALRTSLSTSDTPSLDLSELALLGRLDLEVDATFPIDAPEPPEDNYRVFLRGNELRTDDLVLQDLRGRLDKTGDVIRGDRLTALLAQSPIVLRDVIVAPRRLAPGLREFDRFFLSQSGADDQAGVAVQATIDATDFPFDEHDLQRLEQDGSAPEDLEHWSALLDILGARVFFADAEGEAGRLVMRGPMRLREGVLNSSLPLEVDTAEVQVEQLVLERGGVRAWGKISDLDGRLADRPLTNASMILGFVDKRLTIEDLRGSFVGGQLRSLGAPGAGSRKALGIDLTPPHRFDLAIELRDVDVGRLLQGIFESSIADQGRLDATLQLAGTPADILGLTGRGSLSLNEGRLWSIPAMRELFSSLGLRNTAVFDRLQARFELREGEIQTHFITVKSTLLNLVGQGWHDLDGRLGYELDVRTGLLDRLGILNRVIYWLSGNLVHVSVRGDQARPEVQVRSALLELFRGSPADSNRRLPLPDFAPLAPRF